MLSGAKVLVAGGTGFLGANLVERMSALGAATRSTFHSRAPVINHSNVEHMKADLTSLADCQKVCQGMDYVFMCAANTSGAAVMAETPLAHVTPNVVMNAQMLEAAHQAGVKKFVFISTSSVYPESGDRAVREEEGLRGDPAEVYHAVGWMKRYAEILCETYARRIKTPMPTLVIRPSNIYGPYDKFDPARSHVTAALIRRVAERENPIEVWGTGEDVRDVLFVDDFVDGLLMVFEASGDFDTVNIASGEGHTVKKILETLIALDGFDDAVVTFDPSKPQMIKKRLIDNARVRTRYGFRPRIGLEDGLRRTLDWYRAEVMPAKRHA